MANISLDAVRLLVNSGGWQMRGGRMAKGAPSNMVVSDMTIHEDVIRLHCGNVVEVKNDRLAIDMVGNDHPRQIVISGPFTVRQQRKKIDGGGWHEVEQIGLQPLLVLVNAAAQAEYDAEQTERCRRELAEAQAKAEADQRRAEEARNARISTFLARQKDHIGNARVVDLIGDPSGLMLKFDNGHTLNIELDGGDLYDAWLIVEGGGEKIDLDDGKTF